MALSARALPLSCALCALLACEGDVISLGSGRTPAEEAGPRAAPQPIESLADGDGKDDDPSLTSDLTLLYFNSTRSGGAGEEDIWAAGRDDADAAWQAPEQVRELNSEDRETGIALSADGLSILFSSDRAGGSGGLDVYTARRQARDAAWPAPERVESLSSPGDDLVSGYGADGRVYLARRDDEDDDYDLFVALAAADQSWQEPEPLVELNSDAEESDAFEIAGGAQLLFTRDEDLYLARRGRAERFEDAAPVEALNSDDDDRDPWSTPDLSYVVFSSDRSGPYLLYESQR